jgi:hypothetical protein
MKSKPKEPSRPPQTWLKGPGGVRVLPRYEQQNDGSWKMLHPEAVHGMLQMGDPAVFVTESSPESPSPPNPSSEKSES